MGAGAGALAVPQNRGPVGHCRFSLYSLILQICKTSVRIGSPFLKCVVSIWVLSVRVDGYKGLLGWFGALFSTFARLTEGGLKLFGQCP